MTSIKPSLAALTFAFVALGALAQDGPQRLPAIRLTAGFHLIEAEVAQTPQQRQIGLMNRPSLPPQGGLLFAFEAPGQQCLWM